MEANRADSAGANDFRMGWKARGAWKAARRSDRWKPLSIQLASSPSSIDLTRVVAYLLSIVDGGGDKSGSGEVERKEAVVGAKAFSRDSSARTPGAKRLPNPHPLLPPQRQLGFLIQAKLQRRFLPILTSLLMHHGYGCDSEGVPQQAPLIPWSLLRPFVGTHSIQPSIGYPITHCNTATRSAIHRY